LTHSDHRQPGSNANRAAVVAPMRTTSTCVLSGVRVSSGESKSRVSTPATAVSSSVDGEILALSAVALQAEPARCGAAPLSSADGRAVSSVDGGTRRSARTITPARRGGPPANGH
jgi:type IV pilus biogenesis protein CpaD/CtpE